MKAADLFRKLAALGLTPDQIGSVMDIFDAEAETRKSKARARVQKWRDKNKPETLRNVTETLQSVTKRLTRAEDSSSKKEISGQEGKKDSAAKPRDALDAFRAELSPILDTERIEALIAVRRKKGATFTPTAGRILAKALGACPSPSEAADEMILRNWTGIKPDWLGSKQQPRSGAPPPRERTVQDALAEMSAGTWSGPPQELANEPPTIISFPRRN